jgi:hypothetical protein
MARGLADTFDTGNRSAPKLDDDAGQLLPRNSAEPGGTLLLRGTCHKGGAGSTGKRSIQQRLDEAASASSGAFRSAHRP